MNAPSDSSSDDIAFLERLMRYQDSALTAAELAELESELSASPEKRRLFSLMQMNAVSIYEHQRQDAYRQVESRKPKIWKSWVYCRPITAAAAGLVIGLFSASVVWGYVVPRQVRPSAARLVPVIKGSFEGAVVPLRTEGTPAPGFWSTSPCRVTKTEDGIKPAHGDQMLRMVGVSGTNARGRKTLTGTYSQVVDMRPFRDQFADGCADLKFSALFNAVAETSGQEYTAKAEIYAMRGDPAAMQPDNDLRGWLAREQIATAARQLIFDHDPSAWQSAGTHLDLPPETDYVVICIHVAATRITGQAIPDSFPGQYLDFVRVALVPQARPAKSLPLPFDSES